MRGTDLVLLASFGVLLAAVFPRARTAVKIDLVALGLALLVLWLILTMGVF